MKKLIPFILAISCSFAFAKGAGPKVPVSASSAISPQTEYTPEQKKQLLGVVEVSASMYGYAKATFDMCASKEQLSRYAAVLNTYYNKLGTYSFGKEAQQVYTTRYNSAQEEIRAKMSSQVPDKKEFCAKMGDSIEKGISNLEAAMKATAGAKDPMVKK